MKTLQEETIYPYTFTLLEYGNSHIVRLSIRGVIEREKSFCPTNWDSDTYQPAIECYDKSIEYAKKLQIEELINKES